MVDLCPMIQYMSFTFKSIYFGIQDILKLMILGQMNAIYTPILFSYYQY
jgi:hypothetical protein